MNKDGRAHSEECREWYWLNEVNKVLSHIDAHIGDTDPDGDPATDWKDEHPMHWACWKLSCIVSENAKRIHALAELEGE